jgi:hypothetical protein
MNCCNNDCDQGRKCPNKADSAWTIGDVTFTVVMLTLSATVMVSIMWWLITAVMMIVEVLK